MFGCKIRCGYHAEWDARVEARREEILCTSVKMQENEEKTKKISAFCLKIASAKPDSCLFYYSMKNLTLHAYTACNTFV